MNDNNKIIETYDDRGKVEKEIINQNKNHLTKAHDSDIYNDKIHHSLKDDNVRDKILKGEITREDCDSNNIYEFLKLLKKPNEVSSRQKKSASADDWIKVAKLSKK